MHPVVEAAKTEGNLQRPEPGSATPMPARKGIEDTDPDIGLGGEGLQIAVMTRVEIIHQQPDLDPAPRRLDQGTQQQLAADVLLPAV